jgi:hypothetical protein
MYVFSYECNILPTSASGIVVAGATMASTRMQHSVVQQNDFQRQCDEITDRYVCYVFMYLFITFVHRLSSRFGIILSSELTTLVYCRRVLGKSVKVDKLTQQVTIDIQWGDTLHACPLNTIVEVSVCGFYESI